MGRYSNQGEMASDLQELVDMTSEPSPVIERRERKFHHRLHAEEVAQLITEYQSGVKVKELAVRYHISRDPVIKHAKRAGGVRHRHPALQEAELEQARRLYESGHSAAAVANHFGIDASTVWRTLHQMGIRMRDSQGRER
jgi:DNA invertase Pin-like site-specific DNA recombinase